MAKKSTIARSNKKPKYSSRIVLRCFLCGRKGGYMRKFGLCRIHFRELATDGFLPGIKKIIMVNDPVSNMLVQIKNAQMVYKDQVLVTFSEIKFRTLKILKEGGFIGEVEKKKIKMNKAELDYLLISLKYEDDKKPRISGFKIISKPSRHMYIAAKDIKSIRSGYGLAVISTSKGVMNSKEARKQNLGGEILFEVW